MRRFARTAIAAASLAAAPAQAAYVVHTVTLPDAVVEAANLSSSTLSVGTDQGLSFVKARAVALKSYHDTYVVCEAGGNDDANADRDAIGDWETFIMLEFSDGTVAFRSRTHGYFLRAANGGGSSTNCQTSMVGGYARFTPIEQSNGTYAFRAYSGHYLAAEDDGDLNANRVGVSNWERFTVVDLGAAGMDAMPAISVNFEDMDGDGDEEMVLMLTQQDGTGRLMVDPLGIADTMSRFGYQQGNNYDFWNALSASQRRALRRQVNAVGPYGDVISGGELRHALTRLEGTERTYGTHTYTITLDNQIAGTTECSDGLCVKASIGSVDVTMESSAVGVEYAAASVSLSAQGIAQVTVEAGTFGAKVEISDNRATFGAEASLVNVELGFGDENGTYAGVSVGVGVGFWADCAFGQGDQYGFTLELPVVPVGVALYVEGSDAVWVWNQVSGWTSGAYATTAEAATALWNASVGWAEDATDNVAFAIRDTSSDAISTLQVAGDAVVAGLDDGTDAVLKIYSDAADAVSSAVSSITDTAEDVFNGVTDAVSDFADDVSNAVSDTASNVGSTIKNGFCSIFGC